MEREKGITLISALVMSFVAVAFIGALLFLITNSTQISRITAKYTSSLEVAKGITDYIVSKINAGTLTCGGGTTCTTTNNNVDISGLGLSDYNASATYLGETAGTGFIVYAFRISVSRNNSNETATVEFLYKKDIP